MEPVATTVGSYALSLLQLHSAVTETSCPETAEITQFALQRLGYNVIGYACAGTALLLSACHLTGILTLSLSVPLILSGGAALSFYIASTIIDYADESVLAPMREAFVSRYKAIRYLDGKEIDVAQQIRELFPSLDRDHEVENRNLYGLPYGDDFQEIFAFVRERIPFNEALAIYKRSEEGCRTVDVDDSMIVIPDPVSSWKEIFFNEIRDMEFDEIAKRYNMEDLLQCGVIDDSQKEAIDKFKQIKSEKVLSEEERALNIKRESLNVAIEKVNAHYIGQSFHQEIERQTNNFIKAIEEFLARKEKAEAALKSSYETEKKAILESASVENVDQLSGDHVEQYNSELQRFQDGEKALERQYNQDFDKLNGDYQAQVTPYLDERNRHLAEKERSVAGALRNFALDATVQSLQAQVAQQQVESEHSEEIKKYKQAFYGQ